MSEDMMIEEIVTSWRKAIFYPWMIEVMAPWLPHSIMFGPYKDRGTAIGVAKESLLHAVAAANRNLPSKEAHFKLRLRQYFMPDLKTVALVESSGGPDWVYSNTLQDLVVAFNEGDFDKTDEDD